MSHIQIRISAEDKKAAGEVLERMGLNFSSGIKLFLRRTVQEGKLPFELVASAPQPKFKNSLESEWSGFSKRKIG